MHPKVKSALSSLKIEQLTPMQEDCLQNYPKANSFVLLSPTGSGKTLGFLLPIIQDCIPNKGHIQALIVTPTRELAIQIESVLKASQSGLRTLCVYGGHSLKNEKNSLTQTPDVLIGTPGRLVDHLDHERISLRRLEHLVLDEFDKCLEMGFQTEIHFLWENANQKRTFFSSATEIEEWPDFVDISNLKTTNYLTENKPDIEFLAQWYDQEEKIPGLMELLCTFHGRTIVFCNHREATERLTEHLLELGIPALNFHGKLEQDERERRLIQFRNGTSHYLIATDLAARGLDIPEVETVIHYQIPHKEDAYTHRNGRAGRMNAKGRVVLMLQRELGTLDYIPQDLPEVVIPRDMKLPQATEWETLYFSGGKKEKINKIDLVGFLGQKGSLKKEEIGLITVLDHASYVAIPRAKVKTLLGKIRNEKVKGKKLKIAVSR